MKILAALFALLLMVSPVKAFDAEAERLHTGLMLVTYVESNITPVACPAEVSRVDHPAAVLAWIGLVTGMFIFLECTFVQAEPGKDISYCNIISPDSELLLGHSLRHCFVGDFHVPMLPFLDYK